MEVKKLMIKRNLQSEWKLLRDNIQAINEQRQKNPFLYERTNTPTTFSCSVFLGILLLIYTSISKYLNVYVSLFIVICLSYPCVILAGRRAQDLGISKFYLYSVYILVIGYLGYVYCIERGNIEAFTLFFTPLNIFLMSVLSGIGRKKLENRANAYGTPQGEGIIIWGKRLCADGLFQIYGDYDERTFDFDGAYSHLQFLKDTFNFNGTINQYQFAQVAFIPFNIYAFWLYFGWSSKVPSDVGLVLAVIAIILFLPTLSLIVRRLRDLNYSLFWLPLLFIPVISTYFWLILWWHSNKPIKIISRL